MAVLEKGKSGEAYNLSSGQSCPNINVVKAVLKILGKPKDLIRFVKDRLGHDFRYSINSAKAKQELDYKSEYSFEYGIAETVKWYKDNQTWLNRKVKHLKEYWSKVYE
jgi:dTDP-glucose 4,6-dehydratase